MFVVCRLAMKKKGKEKEDRSLKSSTVERGSSSTWMGDHPRTTHAAGNTPQCTGHKHDAFEAERSTECACLTTRQTTSQFTATRCDRSLELE